MRELYERWAFEVDDLGLGWGSWVTRCRLRMDQHVGLHVRYVAV